MCDVDVTAPVTGRLLTLEQSLRAGPYSRTERALAHQSAAEDLEQVWRV